MNCDTGKVFYIISLKFLSICMLNVNVTFLRRLCFFPKKLKCFCILFIAHIFLKLKKKKAFPPKGAFQNTYRGYKNLL